MLVNSLILFEFLDEKSDNYNDVVAKSPERQVI